MSETTRLEKTESRKGIRIFINDNPYFAPEPAMTGAEILAMAGLPKENQLFLDVPGNKDDTLVAADSTIRLRPGMKFYDVPVGTFG
jgi:hypothetical protein